MTFELSPEHEQFRRSVRDFAEAEIAPHAAQWDRDHHFPTDVVQKMGALGLMGLTAPEEFGGAGHGGRGRRLHLAVPGDRGDRPRRPVDGHHARGRGRAWGSTRSSPTAPTSRRRRGCPSSSPASKIAGFGLTEPGAGSDAGATKTKAVLDDGEWVVNGSKQFITNSGSDITSLVTVTARTGERADGRPEISTIIVPSDTAWLHRGEGVRQARLARLRHPPAVVQRRAGARVAPAR